MPAALTVLVVADTPQATAGNASNPKARVKTINRIAFIIVILPGRPDFVASPTAVIASNCSDLHGSHGNADIRVCGNSHRQECLCHLNSEQLPLRPHT